MTNPIIAVLCCNCWEWSQYNIIYTEIIVIGRLFHILHDSLNFWECILNGVIIRSMEAMVSAKLNSLTNFYNVMNWSVVHDNNRCCIESIKEEEIAVKRHIKSIPIYSTSQNWAIKNAFCTHVRNHWDVFSPCKQPLTCHWHSSNTVPFPAVEFLPITSSFIQEHKHVFFEHIYINNELLSQLCIPFQSVHSHALPTESFLLQELADAWLLLHLSQVQPEDCLLTPLN